MRTKLALLKAASDSRLTKITSFYDIIDKVTMLGEEHHEIRVATEAIQEYRSQGQGDCGLSPLLKQMVLNAERNVQKLSQTRRHDHVLERFATSLFIYCSPIAYQFIHSNMP